MDNRIFKVNGSGDLMLATALSLAFQQEGIRTTCSAYSSSKENGLTLHWTDSDKESVKLPSPLDSEQCLPIVKAWLESEESEDVVSGAFEGDCDHDGHNSMGWIVYCEDWGHVGGKWSAICGIKRCYMWHGK